MTDAPPTNREVATDLGNHCGHRLVRHLNETMALLDDDPRTALAVSTLALAHVCAAVAETFALNCLTPDGGRKSIIDTWKEILPEVENLVVVAAQARQPQMDRLVAKLERTPR